MRLPGRKWFESKVCGVLWTHRLTDAKTLYRLNDGKPCYAVSREDSRSCFYLESEPDDSLRLLVFHELHHIPTMSPGEVHGLRVIYGVTEDDHELFDYREESAATYYGRIYAEAIGGFLKLPKPPRKSSAQ